MMKEIIGMIAAIALITSVLLISGCTTEQTDNANYQDQNQLQDSRGQENQITQDGANGQPPNDVPQHYGNRTRQFGGNMTQEQRQQMMQQMIQSEKDACSGKAENDACSITSPRGSRNGTCTIRNETLLCQMQREDLQRPPMQN